MIELLKCMYTRWVTTLLTSPVLSTILYVVHGCTKAENSSFPSWAINISRNQPQTFRSSTELYLEGYFCSECGENVRYPERYTSVPHWLYQSYALGTRRSGIPLVEHCWRSAWMWISAVPGRNMMWAVMRIADPTMQLFMQLEEAKKTGDWLYLVPASHHYYSRKKDPFRLLIKLG